MKSAHLTSPVAQLTEQGQLRGWYPYCATCDTFGARVRDEDMAADVCRAHEEMHG